MTEKWNPDDYQGRSKKQVENQYTAFSMFVGVVSIIGIALTLYIIFDNIFI
jgi:hypothetical protein